MSDLVGNPEDRFSRVEAQMLFKSGLDVIKLFSCSAQLRLKFILLINVKMPTVIGMLKFILLINVKMSTIVGILTFISRINNRCW